MANDFDNSSGIERCFNQYVTVWRELFSNPIAFFDAESRDPSYQRAGRFAVVNFIIAGILAWLFLTRGKEFLELLRTVISFPLAFALMSVFNAAVYMVCLRTIGAPARYGQLFKITLIIVSIASVLSAIPMLLIPAKILALVLYVLAFMGVFEMTIGRAIWAALTPAVFIIIMILYASIMYRLLASEYSGYIHGVLNALRL